MAIKSKAQIQAESNSTYVDNSVGSITPTSVRSLNTDWIDSIIFAEATASLTVFGATSASFANSATSASNALTASFLLGSVASASFAQFAVSSSQSTSASFASTASFISGNVASASFAISASRAISAATATSASFASTSTSASFAQTASFALNVPATSSFAISASFAQSASLATTNILTASAAANILTFTKGDGTTFNVSIAQSGSISSASFADTANQANSASLAANSLLLEGTGSNGFVTTGSFNTASGSLSTRVTDNTSNIQTLTSATASYAVLANNQTFTGKNTFNNDVTASNVRITGTASIAFLDVTFQSSSVIYSSGSNQFGDASNDTQTLYGTVNVVTGPLVVTGSANFKETITGSIVSASFATSASRATSAATASFLLGTVATASYALSSSGVQGINASTVNSTYYLGFVPNAEINAISIDTDLRYNPSSGILSTNIFSGALNGNATTATNAATASLATSASYALSASQANNATSASFATNAATASSLTALNQTVTITGSVNVSGSIRISQGDDLITHHVQAAAVNGVEIQNNGGNVVALFGAGGSQGTTFYGQVNGTAFSGSGAQIFGVVSSSFATNAATASVLLGAVVSSSYAFTASSAENSFSSVSSSYALTASFALNGGGGAAFPFTGSAGISGSLDVIGRLYVPSGSFEITGSATINSGSLIMYSYKALPASNRPFIAMVTESLNSTNNIISISQGTAQSGSIVISGSGNYVSLTGVQTNASFANGATSGFFGQNAYVTVLPITTGSNPNFNTTVDRNNRRVPSVLNSNVNAGITITDNRASETSTPFSISNSSVNMTATVSVQSGSLGISNSQLLGSATTFIVSGSGTAVSNASISQNIFATAGGTVITFNATSSQAATLTSNLLVGQNIRVNLTGSSTQNSTTAAAPSLIDSAIIGRHLIVTGSSNSGTTTANIAVFGAHNTADGLLNDGRYTKFAIGTGASDASRATAFHVSASGMTTANAGLNVRGIETGATELEVRATGVKIGNLITDSHNLTGSFAISGSQTITGSLVAETISGSFSGSGANIFGVVSSSLATQNLITASAAANILTFTKGDGTTFDVTIAQSGSVVSASYADTANFANSATSASFASTASFLLGSVESASYAFTASSAVNATNALTASSVNGLNQTVTITGSLNVSAGAANFSGGDFKVTDQARNAEFDVDYFKITTQKGTQITGSLNVKGGITGSLLGNASTADLATTASFALTASFFAGSVTSASFAQTSITASFATNFRNSGSYVITGSHRGNVVSQSIASSTASFDFSTGNFFTLNLTGSTLTHISASNIQAGQTVNVRITQGATTGSVSFSPAFDQVSGSGYVPTQVANAVDILTFITFDNSLIYVSNIKNLV